MTTRIRLRYDISVRRYDENQPLWSYSPQRINGELPSDNRLAENTAGVLLEAYYYY